MNPLIILSSNGQVLKWEGFSHACKLKVKGLKVWRIYYTCISFIRNSMKSNKIWWPTFIELGYGILDQTIQPEVEMQLKNGLLILLAKNLIYLILKILIQTRKKKYKKQKMLLQQHCKVIFALCSGLGCQHLPQSIWKRASNTFTKKESTMAPWHQQNPTEDNTGH